MAFEFGPGFIGCWSTENLARGGVGRRRVAWRTSDIVRSQEELSVGTEAADWMAASQPRQVSDEEGDADARTEAAGH
jgi:hypothetical protein